MIGVSVPEGAVIGIPQPELGNRELVQCFRHQVEQCPRCDGSEIVPASVVQAATHVLGGPEKAARP